MIRLAPTLLSLVLLMAACAKRVAPASAIPPPFPILDQNVILEDVRLFEAGLAAFREFTPEGYRRAIQAFQRAVELAPQSCNYQLHLVQANLFRAWEQEMNSEDFHAALDHAQTPPCAAGTAFALRLEAFRSLNNFRLEKDTGEALINIRKAIELDPTDGLNWFVYWKLLPVSTPQENAILKAAEVSPDLALIQYELSGFWRSAGSYDKARTALERAIALSPRHFRSCVGLAQTISVLDPEQNVEPLYKRAVELAPSFLEGRLLLGDYYTGMEETELAEEQYLAALTNNPRFENAHLKLASLYLASERLAEAEKISLSAIEINPESYEAYYYLGNVSLSRSNLTEAQAHYEQSLKIVPRFPDAAFALGTVLFEKKEMERAREQFEIVIRYNSRHADAYFWRAIIRGRKGEYQDAMADCDQALRLYDGQLSVFTQSIEQDERRGLSRKAAADRKRKARIEGSREEVRQLRGDIEAEISSGH